MIPVSVLTGFLGAGKTTLLNRLLSGPDSRDIAIIINEFGEIGLDHLFVETVEDGIIELSSGCLCCTIRGDLVETLENLIGRVDQGAIERPRRVIIETTGLADPAPVLQTIMRLSEDLPLALDGVATLVDAVNGEDTVAAHEEARRQIAVADRIVLSKTDLLADPSDEIRIRTVIASLNPGAPILVNRPETPANIDGLFAVDPLASPDQCKLIDTWLGSTDAHHHHGHHHHDINRHSDSIRSFALTADDPISAHAFQNFVDLLRSAHGANLLRVKGIVNLEERPGKPLVLHGVQHVFHPPVFLESWPDEDRRTRLVFITRDLDESFVSGLFDAFLGRVAPDRADREALTNNPLAIPGAPASVRR